MQTQRAAAPMRASRAGSVKPMALFGRKSSVAVAEPPAKAKTTKGKTTKGTDSAAAKPARKQSILGALDFQEQIKNDRELLYQAKYGELENGKMSREQYQALKRKVGGTARGFFKEWVEEEQVKNIKTYYKPDEPVAAVPFLPFLVGTVVAMLAATVVVVAKTSV